MVDSEMGSWMHYFSYTFGINYLNRFGCDLVAMHWIHMFHMAINYKIFLIAYYEGSSFEKRKKDKKQKLKIRRGGWGLGSVCYVNDILLPYLCIWSYGEWSIAFCNAEGKAWNVLWQFGYVANVTHLNAFD